MTTYRSFDNRRPFQAASYNSGASRGARPARGQQPARRGMPGGGRPNPDPRRRNAPGGRGTSGGRGWRSLSPVTRLAVCAAVVLALLVLAGLGVAKLVRTIEFNRQERFLDNVYVNGICLAGYTRDEGYAVMAQARDERLNTTYALSYNGHSYGFTPSDFGVVMDYDSEMERAWNLGHVGDRATLKQLKENLKEIPAEFNCEISYDAEALDRYIDALADELYVAPVDAEVAVTEEKPVILVASQNGFALNKAQTRENLEALILTGKGDTNLPVEEVEPTISSDNMEMKVVAKFSTDVSFRGADSRHNVRQALSYFNGYVVYPGDTADFNAIVGPRTEGRGFRAAPEYAGNELKKGVGGGVCQASTTLYNAAIMANMTILERHSHNMTVSYVEPSQDAAVEYGADGKNLVFRNDTEHAIYIYTNVDRENATITVYGTRPKYHYELQSVIVDEKKSDRKRYEYDMDGKYCYYITDKPVLKTKGHGSCRSEGWLVAYDWDTKEEISREQISYDVYTAGVNVYWRGVHDANGNVIDPEQTQEGEGEG